MSRSKLTGGSFSVIASIWIKCFEEPDLEQRFGKDYITYCEHVPRWIPRLTPYEHQQYHAIEVAGT